MDEPSPAPRSTSTVCPARTSSVTPAGVSATRYSRFLTSRGTPTRIFDSFAIGCGSASPEGDGRSPPRGRGPGRSLPRPESRHAAPRCPSTRPTVSLLRASCGRPSPDRRWPGNPRPARRMSMRLYAQRPDLRLRQILGDAGLVAWTVVWVLVARAAHAAVLVLAEPGAAVEDLGRSVARNMESAAETAGRIPVAGDELAKPFQALGDAGDSVGGAGQAAQDAVGTLATIL